MPTRDARHGRLYAFTQDPAGGGLELFFQGRPMRIARWPNEGFVKIADIVVEDGHEIHGHKGSKTGKFKYDGDRPKQWVKEKDPWLHGYWFWDWSYLAEG